MTNVIQYRGNQGTNAANTDVGPSPFIWADCPWNELDYNPNKGFRMSDEFNSFGGTVSSSVGTYSQGYKSYQDSTSTITGINTEVGGVLRLATAATDDFEATIESGYGNGGPFKVTGNTGPKLWFETRVRFAQIVTQNFFIGLGEKGLAVTDGVFSDSNAVQDKSLLGFYILAAASSTLVAMHQKNGGSGATNLGTAQTIVADTWYKLGIIFDQNALDSKYCRWFVNGVEKFSITDANVAKFPSAVVMNLLASLKNSAAAANTVDIDWIRCAQLRA